MTVEQCHCSKLKKVGFLPNRQKTGVSIFIDLDPGRRRKKKPQASIYALSEFMIYEFMYLSLKHKLGTVT